VGDTRRVLAFECRKYRELDNFERGAGGNFLQGSLIRVFAGHNRTMFPRYGYKTPGQAFREYCLHFDVQVIEWEIVEGV
jgi:hypothetical protein